MASSSVHAVGEESVPSEHTDGVSVKDDVSTVTELPSVPAETVCDVLNISEWLDGQLYDQLSHIGADKVDVPLTRDIETARARVSKLQSELLSESSKRSVKEQTLRRLQFGSALAKELFTSTEEKDEESRKDLEGLVVQQTKLVSDILKEAAGIETLRTELKNLRDKNFEMKARNRQAMKQIRERQNLMEQKADDFRKDQNGQRKKEHLEDEIKKIIIQRHTFQGLILGSGINWAEDQKMEELLLSLGAPLTI